MAVSAKLGELFVQFVAQTRGFDGPLGKSRAKVNRFAKTMATSAIGVRQWGGTLLAAAGVGGVGYMVKETLSSIDSLAKQADMLGVSTEKLGAYRYAASLAGVEERALTEGIKKLGVRIGQAAHGMGEAQDTLREMGFDAKKLASLGLETQFELIATSLSGMRKEDQLRHTSKLFEVEGVALINLFTSNIKAAEREYAAMNGTIARTDAAKVEMLNDRMTQLGATAKSATKDIAVAMAPILSRAAEGASIAMEESAKAARNKTGLVGKVLAPGSRYLTQRTADNINFFTTGTVEGIPYQQLQATRQRIAEQARSTSGGLERNADIEAILASQKRMAAFYEQIRKSTDKPAHTVGF